MRSFRISVGILAVILAFAVFNSFYVHHKLDEIQTLVMEIPDDKDSIAAERDKSKSTAEQIYEKWDKFVPYLTFVASYTELNRADDAILELRASIDSENYEDAVTARAKLLDALRRMWELEGLSPQAIF